MHTILFHCSTRQTHSTSAEHAPGGRIVDAEPVTILHPDVARAESLIRSAWQDAHLVAD